MSVCVRRLKIVVLTSQLVWPYYEETTVNPVYVCVCVCARVCESVCAAREEADGARWSVDAAHSPAVLPGPYWV